MSPDKPSAGTDASPKAPEIGRVAKQFEVRGPDSIWAVGGMEVDGDFSLKL